MGCRSGSRPIRALPWVVISRTAAARLLLGFGFRRGRLFGQHEEIVEDFLRQLVVVEQRAAIVGDDELIGLLAVTHRVGVLFVVFD
jgi:hypothetical protein